MQFLAVDDEMFMLKKKKKILGELYPDAQVLTFTSPEKALAALKTFPADVAFLDIKMQKISGLELAVRLKKIKPDMHIIFVTGYQKYALDAFRLHATGYLLKPVDIEDVRRELTFIYDESSKRKHIVIQTFGGFELFVDGQPVRFGRAKAKELLAYLVDHRGATVTMAEACTALFEEAEETAASKGYFRQLVYDLKNTLKIAGAEENIKKSFNSYAVLPDKFDCDYYRFIEGDPIAINAYHNDYMPSYSWGEFRNAELGFEKWLEKQ